jgi:alpha-galactosidase
VSVAPPDFVAVWTATDSPVRTVPVRAGEAAASGVVVSFDAEPRGLAVTVTTDGGPVARVALRWSHRPVTGLVLGDAWERGYGELGWQPVRPERLLPWYWLAHDPATGTTTGMGVRVGPAAFCAWTVDGTGTTLWLDLRNGALPLLGPARRIPAATVVGLVSGAGSFAAVRALCALMAPASVPTAGPLVGVNDWNHAYGEGTSAATTLRDAHYLSDLAGDGPVRPFAVVDGGWSEGGGCAGGPYTRGLPGRFDDMPALARDVRALGVRPGIWIRPTATADPVGRALQPGPRPTPELPLDLSVADTLESVRRDVGTVVQWGYELLKFDFSTFDLFGRFGHAMGWELTDGGWHHDDRSLTNAELLTGLYRAIAEAAGDAVLIACNTVGHLAAGLVHAQRIADDTSGQHWELTRRMGVNGLAFRLPQHGVLFAADPDFVACTPQTPWELNRRYLDVVARSGTPLFLAVDPPSRSRTIDEEIGAAVRLALAGGEPGGLEPVDWLQTSAPRRWRGSDGTTTHSWDDTFGAGPWGA